MIGSQQHRRQPSCLLSIVDPVAFLQFLGFDSRVLPHRLTAVGVRYYYTSQLDEANRFIFASANAISHHRELCVSVGVSR